MSNPGEAIVVARNLQKVFPAPRGSKGAPIVAVDDVSFELHPNECLAIVGESGSGKTTVARMLVGLETVTAGELTVRGESRAAVRASRLPGVPRECSATLDSTMSPMRWRPLSEE